MNTIFPIVLLVASIGVFWGYVNPAYTAITGSPDIAGKSVKELQAVAQDYTDALNKTAEIERVRDGLLSKFNNIKETDKERLSKLLPDHIDSVRLIIEINNIAARYGMSLANIAVTASAPKAPTVSGSAEATPVDPMVGNGVGPDTRQYTSVKLGFSVSGTYDDFMQFVKELEQSLRVVEITSLSFATTGGVVPGSSLSTPPAGSYIYTVAIQTYYLK